MFDQQKVHTLSPAQCNYKQAMDNTLTDPCKVLWPFHELARHLPKHKHMFNVCLLTNYLQKHYL